MAVFVIPIGPVSLQGWLSPEPSSERMPALPHEEMGPRSSSPRFRTQTPPPWSGVCGNAPPGRASLSLKHLGPGEGPGGPAPAKPPSIPAALIRPHPPGPL